MKGEARTEVKAFWGGFKMSEIISQITKTSDYMELALRASIVGFSTAYHDQLHFDSK